ncbi:alpha/beta hydrolase [Mucilaginibacter terrae]|uniref:alpha/beta hydrolase n=1 Tax=Mucilaginibacter terrae TaxID=1955052 RepID=UPI00363FC7C9
MKNILTTLALAIMANFAFAQEGKTVDLYPKGVPGSKKTPAGTYIEKTVNSRASKVSNPVLIPFVPEKGKANGAAIVICPGGGYSFLSMENEGYAIARKFNEIGVTAFILKYRLPSDSIMVDKTIGPLQDAQRAIQLIRQRAQEWGVDAGKVGIIGFSAGGHLASTALTHFDKAVIDNKDNINLRPDFGVLLYPVVNLAELAHKGSKDNLLGKSPSQEMIDLYSNEKQVTSNTPPTFLVHAEDDKTVPVMNSVVFYQAMVKAGVKGELHTYQAGGHGFGLNNKTTKDQWFDRCANWMDANGWLAAK